ncbi:hypothetical protein [Streptomyces sp. NBC_01443]|uniref:hypothetical protein n=1 Tax=Streptomyces sp. NBC_01443 TaxID=2903868 RepID=UPI0022554A51|nr:hypothetical protein [Streptomyces sp. NBC_01443]MCX4626284.1 TfoX/Sxy family protein [Streptomyces sp. NBC_01443]
MTDPDALFDHIAADLAPRGVTAGAMFGARALKAHGKVFACLNGDALAVKLGVGTPAHTEALSLPGVELFDPSGAGRPFKDWVALPTAQAGAWPHYAETGLAGLGG